MNAKAFREIPAPAKKADYVGQYLFLREDSPGERKGYNKHFPDRPYRKDYAAKGDIVQIVRRLNAQETCNNSRDVFHWGAVRVLDVSWDCTTCGTTHRDFIPEAWIEEGKAVFVEKFTTGEEKSCQKQP